MVIFTRAFLLFNSMIMNDLSEIITFQRTHGESMVCSVIDYIYVGQQFRNQLVDTRITRLNSDWSDHSILQIQFSVGKSPTDPGLWRANPVYANHTMLQNQIMDKISKVLLNLKGNSTQSPEEKWDQIKSATKRVIRSYGYEYVNWRSNTIKHLEKKRNRILRSKPNIALRTQLIGPIDQQLGQLQQELTEIDALKAGFRWREKGEKSAGFLKSMHQRRTVQQYITTVKRLDEGHTNIGIVAEAPHDRTSDPSTMREIVRQYYQKLYNRDHVEPNQIDSYLRGIQFHRTVKQQDNEDLIAPITMEEILEQVPRSPKNSSPGNDGLGYQYLKLLFNMEALQPLILEVYNNALAKGNTPQSWKDIRVRLLPKKGDLAELKNWRPISLINCDVKTFTRVLNTRIAKVANQIIQPTQTGFIKGRFIGDNGLCCKHDLFSVRHQSGQCSTMLILSLCFDSFVTSVKRYIWKSMLSATNLHKLSITEHKVVLEWITINPC
jgi:hypothetical protein